MQKENAMKLMRAACFLVLLVVPSVLSFSQNTVSAQSQFTYNFMLSPDTAGTLNGRFDLGYAWTPWLSSGASAYTDNYSQTIDTASDVSTLTSTGRTVSVTPLRINQNLLWRLLGTELSFLEFSAGVVGVLDWTTQKQYGYDPSQASPLFYLDSTDKTSLRPIQSYTLGLQFGPIDLSGKFESTIIWANETVKSSRFSSDMASPPAATTITYYGGDTLIGGSLVLDLGIIKPIGNFQYFLHVMTDGTAKNTFKSETYTYGGSIVLSFIKVSGGSPVIG
ncbi:MAG: hypothetical protein WCT14_10530, partial [Treponemataceae bacterium]